MSSVHSPHTTTNSQCIYKLAARSAAGNPQAVRRPQPTSSQERQTIRARLDRGAPAICSALARHPGPRWRDDHPRQRLFSPSCFSCSPRCSQHESSVRAHARCNHPVYLLLSSMPFHSITDQPSYFLLLLIVRWLVRAARRPLAVDVTSKRRRRRGGHPGARRAAARREQAGRARAAGAQA